MIIEIKCTTNVMSFNHPQTTLSFTGPWKNYLPKTVLDAKKAGTTALGTQVNSAEGFFPLGSRELA